MNAAKVMCAVAAVMALAGHVAGMPAERRAALLAGLGMDVARPSAGRPAVPASNAVATAQPAAPQGSGAGLGIIDIPPDRHGQFQTAVDIEGQRIPVLVDTGATLVSLTFEDAGRLGIRPMPSDYRVVVNTANGPITVARTEIAEIRLGGTSVRRVDALVHPRGTLGVTLLGMSFLSRLRGFRVEAGHLILQP